MSTCQIADVLKDASGHTHDGKTVYGWPLDNATRIQDGGGVYRTIDPDTGLDLGYQYGVASTTMGGGLWSFNLPRSSEQLPTTAVWFIRLPDGKTYKGVPPDAVGPFTVSDLVTTYGWAVVSGGTVTPAGAPGLLKGELTLTEADYYDFVFTPGSFTSDKYHVGISLQECQASVSFPGGGAPGWYWTSRSQNGIRINFTSTYTGIVTFRFEAE